VNPIPVVDIGDLFEICEGETQVLANSVPATNYSWSNQSNTPTITVSSSGIYKLIVNGVGNCIGIDSAQVIVHPLPGGLTDAQWTICDGEEIVINGGNPANTYEWSNGEVSPSVTLDQSGTYTVKITSPFGCISNYNFEIGYFCEPVLFVPNSFTPNNDGVNDVFMVYGEFIAEMNLSIFNRWGERIFQTADVNPVWTGDVNDGEHYSQDGHYNWVMRYKVYSDAFGNVSDWKEMAGTVIIVR
jgi:gliding motility-associated-like protein